jgi:hypothetical protein
MQNAKVTPAIVKLVSSLNRNSALAEKQLLEALGKSTRTAYSYDNFNDCNFVIENLPTRFRSVAVSFFKRMGLVVVENRGELPRVKRVEDKSKQKEVFEKIRDTENLGLNKVTSEADLQARAEKADERTRKFIAEKTINDRVLAYMQTAIKTAQGKNDLEAVNALSNIVISIKGKTELKLAA